MEPGMSRSEFMNEDGHGRPTEAEKIAAEIVIDEAKDWIKTQIAMLEESAKHAGLNGKISDSDREAIHQALDEVFAYEVISENQKIVDGD